MKTSLVIIGLLVTALYGCNQRDKTTNRLLGPGRLASQVFQIDNSKDTILHTKKGAIIRIPRGVLSSVNKTVQLEVKEAYSMQDILRAGLTTQSNGRPLSSGGMIYINAVGENTVKITQKISIAIPAPFLEKNMQLFKGEMQSDSTINWTDPRPLAENPQLTALEAGKSLFDVNCASCHSLAKDLTGPALAHIMKRSFPALYDTTQYGLDHFYEFTRNPANVMAREGYYRCLKEKFGGAVMTPFDLTDTELDQLYAWVENESERRALPVPDNGILKCRDSCQRYLETSARWNKIKAGLENDTVEMVQEHRTFAAGQPPLPDTAGPPTKVSPLSNSALYYQFTVEAFGWYNIDMLLRSNADLKLSELRVRIQGAYKERFHLYLLIPAVKTMEAGGPLPDEADTYGFFEADGTIPLPQNTKAFVIAMGEHEDQVIFASKEFITREKQVIDLSLTATTKEAFQQQLAALSLNDIAIKVNDTKNAAALRQAIRELKNAEQLKPKQCDCDCFVITPIPTRTAAETEYLRDY
ncbi:c-type cytochrome [Longitalea arenae]|uniref:c-type cytochrome n=1 Tax=Longitalea arenae TaxID=2812558 RepID=UPI001968496E|nr:cytochrome c [Longitalea arenae]